MNNMAMQNKASAPAKIHAILINGFFWLSSKDIFLVEMSLSSTLNRPFSTFEVCSMHKFSINKRTLCVRSSFRIFIADTTASFTFEQTDSGKLVTILSLLNSVAITGSFPVRVKNKVAAKA